MTKGGGSHGGRSRMMLSMASIGGTVDDTVGHDGIDATGDESRTVNSRHDAWLETDLGALEHHFEGNYHYFQDVCSSYELCLEEGGGDSGEVSIGQEEPSNRVRWPMIIQPTHHGGTRCVVDHMRDLLSLSHNLISSKFSKFSMSENDAVDSGKDNDRDYGKDTVGYFEKDDASDSEKKTMSSILKKTESNILISFGEIDYGDSSEDSSGRSGEDFDRRNEKDMNKKDDSDGRNEKEDDSGR
ncbi:hypothetical protein C2S51_026713 [Perilla frutescens var. frutescens]|nr:hypothetical protein C2S51_026713 [Perilla frutescens var. frutescens]